MGMFDLSATTGVKESGNFLQPGIYKAKFVSVELSDIHSQNTGQDYKTMKLTLDIDGYGEFTHNFFEPTSAERTASQFGPNPSPAEHFMIAVRQIIDALNPEIGQSIDEENVVVNGDLFGLIVAFSVVKAIENAEAEDVVVDVGVDVLIGADTEAHVVHFLGTAPCEEDGVVGKFEINHTRLGVGAADFTCLHTVVD